MSIRLMCGDCLHLMKRIEDGSVDLVLCDLPYGVTKNKWDTVLPFDDLWAAYRRILKPNGAVVLTASQPFTSALVMSNPRWFKYECIWHKDSGTGFLNAKHQPLRNHENVCVFYNKRPIYNPQFTEGKPYTQKSGAQTENYGDQVSVVSINSGTRCPTTVIYVAREKRCPHPTQKPVALMEYMIKTYTHEGDTVLDNCMGSGTTGVAAKLLNRNFIGIELSQEYFDLAKQRIADTAAPVEARLPFIFKRKIFAK